MVWRASLVVVALVLLCLAFYGLGRAQTRPPCAPHAFIVEKLQDKFSEVQHGIGIVGTDTIFELYVAKAGTWTILKTNRLGISCVVLAGSAWEVIAADFDILDSKT